MEFRELIEARRSVRKYVASDISKAEVEVIVGEALNAPSWKNTEVTRYYAAVSAANELGEMWGAYDCGLASASSNDGII